MQISEAQRRAISLSDGPAMILAGPGSGKTFVITRRTKQLIDTSLINPREILVITFTKAAAAEMRERFQMICSSQGTTFGTFHAVFFTILRQAYSCTFGDVMSEEAKQGLLRRLLRSCEEEGIREGEMLRELAAEISFVKNERIPPESYASRSCPDGMFCRIFKRYEEVHRQQGLLDFDDMLTCTYELLTQREDILRSWQQRWKYILVDEFQDINLLQYEILKLLAEPQNNLFVVGDDDQSIYRFRGAKPEIMQQFLKDYPGAERILLDQNFRSTVEIVEAAGKVIEKNTHRFPKVIRSACTAGEPVEVRAFLNQDHESLHLVQQIQKSTAAGTPLCEIAVLVRTNRQAAPFAARLAEFDLPFTVQGLLPDLFDHWIAKDVFAYLHLAYAGLDRSAFLQVMNRPKRCIGRESIREPVLSFDRLRSFYRGNQQVIRRLDEFEHDLGMLRMLPPYAAVNYIRVGIRYEDYLKEYADRRHMAPEELTDLLDEVQESAKPCRTVEAWQEQIGKYRAALRKSRETAKNKGADAVTVSTLHAAKGLEFSEVFIPDVNEGILPHRLSAFREDAEEERRLFYVGMTRARDRLHLFHIRERYGKVMEPSEFLEPIIL